jgi:tetratricopeptide (TPR) repeat protein
MKENHPIRLRGLRTIATAVALILCGLLVYRSWWLFLGAWITRNGTPDPAIYERAIHYDPNNADYRFQLAQIYNYSTQYLNVKRAGDEYEAAVRLNPDRSSHWLELAKYYEQTGNLERCRYSVQMALQKDPNYAQTHWAAANVYIRLNDLTSADLEMRRTADLDGTYLTQVLDLAWRFYGDAPKIISTHLPNTKIANLTALNYFISKNSEEGASLAWTRLSTFQTTPQERFAYVDYLASLKKQDEALTIFLIGETRERSLIYNGSFETEPLNGGFDWRFSSNENAEARRDMTTSEDGQASFLVSFNGKENVDYSQLWHWVPVHEGKTYALKFWMKTEGITTNEGMFVEIGGKASEKQIGSTNWQEFTIRFTAPSNLVTISLRRVPSTKFDNLLKGKVWLDGFTLLEAG